MEQWTVSKLRKEYIKAVYCHPAYLTYMQNTSCEILGWMKHKLESRLPGEISITLDCKEIQPALPKGNQSWIFIGRTDAEPGAPILWPPYAKSWLIWKDPDPGKDGGQEEKGTTEDEIVGWHHQLNGYEFEQALGIIDWRGSLECCGSWSHKELDMTEQLNWTD